VTREEWSTLEEFLDAIPKRPEPTGINWDERYDERFEHR
jgi:hypothetical protein